MEAFDNPPPKPLAGLKVLELARVLAGPWAGQILADLGAEVIKIERPGSGDDTRAWGPPFIEGADGEDLSSAYFHSANRGKRSVAIDFETEDGRRAIAALAAGSDVFIENFKVGALRKYGLDADTLRAAHPGLVYCSITGFGQTGPYAARAGYDYLIQGMGGIMDITGDPAGEPTKTGVAYADIFTGVYASTAILAALRRRDATGEGAHIDMALLDTQVGVLANQGMNYLASGTAPRRMGNEHPNLMPYGVFPASDGPLIIAVGNDRQFERLCAFLGLAALAADPAYAVNAARVRNRVALAARLGAETTRRTRAEILDGLEALGVPAGPINRLDQVFADAQVVHRGLRLTLGDEGSPVPSLAGPIVIDGRRMVSDRPSPRLGADTASVLAALSITRKDAP